MEQTNPHLVGVMERVSDRHVCLSRTAAPERGGLQLELGVHGRGDCVDCRVVVLGRGWVSGTGFGCVEG